MVELLAVDGLQEPLPSPEGLVLTTNKVENYNNIQNFLTALMIQQNSKSSNKIHELYKKVSTSIWHLNVMKWFSSNNSTVTGKKLDTTAFLYLFTF